MRTRFGVIVFPGSNCDHDAQYVAERILGQEARFIWHKEGSLGELDVVIVTGDAYVDHPSYGAAVIGRVLE